MVEGHRSVADQQAIIARYSAEVCAAHPGSTPADLDRLTSRFVAPLAVAPHVAGAAVDLTLVDALGDELDLGTPIDATPEQSGGALLLRRRRIGAAARAHRRLLATVLTGAGLRELPHRVVALELRRPLLGARHRRGRRRCYGPVELAGVSAA